MASSGSDKIYDSFIFLESGQYSDFTIRCKEHEWKVHRAIICGQSGFFRRMCANGFKETTECAVDLVDDDPVILAQMMLYLYSPRYYISFDDWEVEKDVFEESRRRINVLLGFNKHNAVTGVEHLSMHVKLHGISRKYDIPELRRRTCELFPAYMRYIIDDAEKGDLQFSEDIIDTAKILYGSTQESDRSIKETIIYAAQRLAKSLGRHDNDQPSETLRLVAHSCEEFTWDMLSVDFSSPTSFHCSACLKAFTIDHNSSDNPTGCDCGARGICGRCSPVNKLACQNCYDAGSCEVLWRTDTKIGNAME